MDPRFVAFAATDEAAATATMLASISDVMLSPQTVPIADVAFLGLNWSLGPLLDLDVRLEVSEVLCQIP